MSQTPQTIDVLELGSDAPSTGFIFSLSPIQMGALLRIPTERRLETTKAMVALYRSRWTELAAKGDLVQLANAALADSLLDDSLHQHLIAYALKDRFPPIPYDGRADLVLSYFAGNSSPQTQELKFSDIRVQIIETGELNRFLIKLVEPLVDESKIEGLYRARVITAEETALIGRIAERGTGMGMFILQEDQRV